MQTNSSPEATAAAPATQKESADLSAPRRSALLIVLASFLVFGCVLVGWIMRDWWLPPRSLDEIHRSLELKKWDKASRQIRLYLARHPAEPQALLLHGRVLGAKDQFAECAQVLETVPTDAAERAQALLQAGRAWQEASRRRDAERCWQACLDLTNGDVELPLIQQQARRFLCGLYAMERRRAELWTMTEQMAEHAPPQLKHEPLAMRVRFEFTMVEPQVAIGILEPTLDTDPQDLYSRRALGVYHLEAGSTDKARAQLYQCLQQARDNVLMWETWLQCLYQTADLFGLEQAIRDLPPVADASAECWKYRAIVAERKDDINQAVDAARQALTLQPSEPENYHRLGQLLMRAGKKSEGQSHLARNQELQKALQELRDAYDAYRRDFGRSASGQRTEIAYRLAQAYGGLERRREAAAWYRTALAENPAHAPSIAALEQLQN